MRLNIKDKLKELGMTRYELAKRIGVTYPTITAIFNGNSTSIKLEILESMCKELNCTPNDIIISDDPTVRRLLAYSKTSDLISNKIDTVELTKQLLLQNGIGLNEKSEKTLDSVSKKLEEYMHATKSKNEKK